MGALRAARTQLGEEGAVPQGASCSVAPDGVVTILDSASRRRFVLTPASSSLPAASNPPEEKAVAAAPAAQAAAAAPPSAAHDVGAPAAATAAHDAASGKKRKFQTMAYVPGTAVPGMGTPPSAATPSAAQPQVAAQQPVAVLQPVAVQAAAPVAAPAAQPAAEAPAKKKKKFETVAFTSENLAEISNAVAVGAPAAAASATANVATPAAQPAPAARAPSTPNMPAADEQTPSLAPSGIKALELLMTRDEEPTPQNPLTYRERAYLIPRGMSVTEAEAALRFTLAELQTAVRGAARGKFVNLAAFDHRWTDEPERPPLIVLEWRDWRGDPIVDYPAAERSAAMVPEDANDDADERMAIVFEALHELAHLRSPAQALDFAAQLLDKAVPSAAISSCLYDINTDELRFVAVTGPGAAQRQGSATPRSAGLLGLAGRVENAAMVIPDVRVHPAYDPTSDGREGLETQCMVLCPVVHEGQLLAMLQLINRQTGAFSAGDVHIVNYIGAQLAAFLHQVRGRVQR